MVYSDTIFDGIKISESVDLWRKGDLSGTYAARSIYLDVTGRGFTLTIKGKVAKDAQLVDLDFIQINTGKAEPVLNGDLVVSWSTNRQYVIINPPPFVRLESVGAGTLTVYGSFSTEAYSQSSGAAASPGLQEVAQLDPDMLQTSAKLTVEGEDVDEINRLPVEIADGASIKVEGVVSVNDGIYIIAVPVPGIDFANVLDANDAIGTVFPIDVPEYGIIEGFKLIDPDDDVLALTAHLFTREFVGAASDAAFTISAVDATFWVTSVTFDAPLDIGAAKVAEEVGSTYYHAPAKKLWCQCSTTGTPNIAAGLSPILVLAIRPKERYGNV